MRRLVMSDYVTERRELKVKKMEDFLNNLPNKEYRSYKKWKNISQEYEWIKKHLKRLQQPSINGKGWYKKYFCDSTWELVFIIYNLEHNIKFEKEPKGFDYKFQGREYTYYPDFYLEDEKTYIEIKSSLTPQDKCKVESFKEPLVVLKNKDLQKHFEYVIKKYGEDLIALYENAK